MEIQMKIAISGASGFVASALIKKFPNYVVIERRDSVADIVDKLRGVDAVFNLAGAPIIKRWNDAYKKVLLSSRVDTTKKLVEAINLSDVKQFISTSAVGVYPNDKPCDESCGEDAGDFLAGVVKAWEHEALLCNKPTAIVRFGVVLGKGGGALSQMLPPFKMGVGGVIGDGSMMMSWIDIEDLVRIYEHIIDNRLSGTFNATAPQPVSNREFTKALGAALHRPTLFPLPIFVLKLIFGEASVVLTDSKEVYPKALLESGFSFKYGDIQSSLAHIVA